MTEREYQEGLEGWREAFRIIRRRLGKPERDPLAELAERYRLEMRTTLDDTGGPMPTARDWGLVYRVEFTVLDPETRLHRTGVGWSYSYPPDDEEERPRLRSVLRDFAMECRHREESVDEFDWLVNHPGGTFNRAEDAREEWHAHAALCKEMRQLFGPAGYAELISAAPPPEVEE